MHPDPTRTPEPHTFTIDHIRSLCKHVRKLVAELPATEAAMLDLLIARAAAAPLEIAAFRGDGALVPAIFGGAAGAGVVDPVPYLTLALGVGALTMIGPKQDDPRARGGALMIGPKQDDPSPRPGLAMIGPKQDDPVKLTIRTAALDTHLGREALAMRDARFSAVFAGEHPTWLTR